MIFLSFGFDFTDEAYYLLSISDPWEYDVTATQFGLIYYPLYKLLQGNIFYIRLFNFVSIFCINIVLSYLFLRYFKLVNLSKGWLLILSWVLSTLSLCVYGLWLPTPNYNLLNFQALSSCFIGVILVSQSINFSLKHKNFSYFTGWIVIGLSGFLAFMSRPHTGTGLAVLVLIWAWLSSNFKLKGITIAVIVSFALVFLTAIILDGSITAFIHRYTYFYELTKISRSHETNLAFNLTFQQFFTLITLRPFVGAFLALTAVGGLLSYFSEPNSKNIYFSIIYITIPIFLCTVILIIHFLPQFNNYIGHLLWAPVFGALVFRPKKISGEKRLPTKSRFGWCAFLLAFAYLYGLGSNNLITFTTSISTFFIFLALILVLSPSQNLNDYSNKIIGLITCSFFVTILVITLAWATPYRQIAPLWTFSAEVEIPLGGTKLKMPAPMANFVTNWYEAAQKSSYEPGTPIIDLTGRAPGAIYLLGGYFPKAAWLGYGYEGSEQSAQIALKRLSCEQLASAWLITDYTGADVLNPSILLGAGVDYENDYSLQGVFDFPLGFKSAFFRPLVLLSPKIPERRTEICLSRRAVI